MEVKNSPSLNNHGIKNDDFYLFLFWQKSFKILVEFSFKGGTYINKNFAAIAANGIDH